MRLWSLDPEYLDRAGLLAVWREGLLAKKVLLGKTRGYKNHPQLIRFKGHKNHLELIDSYLFYIIKEAEKRHYHFDGSKIGFNRPTLKIKVNSGQIDYEFQHLLNKLKKRDRAKYKELLLLKKVKANKLFKIVKGGIENWERV